MQTSNATQCSKQRTDKEINKTNTEKVPEDTGEKIKNAVPRRKRDELAADRSTSASAQSDSVMQPRVCNKQGRE